ncbi:MAG: EAL domain-containing protein [Betaproteobacteria bacterium]|nr:EAL domain-containing protein [Betaproteobacteria bacterium]
MAAKLLRDRFSRLSAAFRRLNAARWFRLLLPAALTMFIGAPLVFVIFFTALDWQWVAFLSGILLSAFLALASRASKAEWRSMRRTSQLSQVRDHLAKEVARRQGLETALRETEEKLRWVDRDMPVILAFVDAERRCRFHNQAFGEWVNLPAHRIDGHLLSEVLGRKIYAAAEDPVRRALAGECVEAERSLTTAEGRVFRHAETYVPHFGEGANVAGFYLLAVDVTAREDLASQGAPQQIRQPNGENPDAVYADAIAQELTHWENPAEYVSRALETNQFAVYAQEIRPVGPLAAPRPMLELLVRLREEEESMLPPGAFIPVLEHYNLMPALDRWVVRQVLDLYARRRAASAGWAHPLCSVNLSRATLADGEFPGWVRQELASRRIPADGLGFEIDWNDAGRALADARRLVKAMGELGCPVALAGFSPGTAAFEALKQLPVQYIKIDGGLVVNIARDPVALAKVGAISRVSRVIGVKTVAEFVENQDILDRLGQIGIDYAQGFLFSRPQPLETLI